MIEAISFLRRLFRRKPAPPPPAPVDRGDGCTPTRDPDNPYKCGKSNHHVARLWTSDRCPAHRDVP